MELIGLRGVMEDGIDGVVVRGGSHCSVEEGRGATHLGKMDVGYLSY